MDVLPRLYDAVIIHAEYTRRRDLLEELKSSRQEAFPIQSLDCLREFLSGRNCKNQVVSQGERRAKRYILSRDPLPKQLTDKTEKVTYLEVESEIKRRYDPNAIIEYTD